MRRAYVAAVVAAMVQAGCAGKSYTGRPEDIPRLEQEAASNTDAAIQLGAAYVAAKRYQDAKRVLGPIVEKGTNNGAAYLYLGIANEELDDFAAARTAYERYIQVGRDANLKADIRTRLALVTRQELKQSARLAIANEQRVSAEPPTPNTIAVLPFDFPGATEELRPLQTALADMMITDLSVSPRSLQPIERSRMQALVDEMLLGAAGFTNDATRTTQAGRLLKAENVVQGAIVMSGANDVRVDGQVLNTVQRTARGGAVQGQGQIQTILDVEKQLVFQIYTNLSITLTEAERQRINNNRTSNLIAFLAYGRGLQAMDRGNYTEATQHFNQAAQADPQFSAARTQRQESVQLQQANQVSTDEIATQGVSETSLAIEAVPAISSTTDLLQSVGQELNPSPAPNLTNQGNTGDGVRNTQQRNNGQQEAQGQSSGGLQQALKAVINISICNVTIRQC
jgi:tetratricopeptide (TPR) repeat protein